MFNEYWEKAPSFIMNYRSFHGAKKFAQPLFGTNFRTGTDANVELLIIDGHPLIAEGLRRILSERQEIKISYEASFASGETAFKEMAPDITVVEQNLPDGSGIEFLETVLLQDPSAKFIVLAANETASAAAIAMEAGAKAFLGKSAVPETIIDALEKVAEGKNWLPDHLLQEVATLRLSGAAESGRLSKREVEILRSLAYGESLNEIAFKLGVSYKTIAKESNRLRDRYGAKSLPELVRLAISKMLF